ncbi:hypothetical protein SAMN05192583_1030 [Sphingomonas gellani]|uniref:Uncharacterized protein n=1 Tax=Sphingomonas gellani TaxID=1166340 RepID=A0A1H8ARG8_9SPHN|nr:hypothetical protein SAMN05192583_1030 [Sphingomonas gellani]
MAALSNARVRLSRASGARTQYINETLIPELRARADRSMLAELAELQRVIAAKRLASSVHVSVWSSKAIAGDWRGYCQAARSIWAMMEEQMSRERRIFGSL